MQFENINRYVFLESYNVLIKMSNRKKLKKSKAKNIKDTFSNNLFILLHHFSKHSLAKLNNVTSVVHSTV